MRHKIGKLVKGPNIMGRIVSRLTPSKWVSGTMCSIVCIDGYCYIELESKLRFIRENFPSLRKLKKKNRRNVRYPPILTNTDLDYVMMFQYTTSIVCEGDDIRLKNPNIKDHNPKTRRIRNGVIATTYNAYKPIRVTGTNWEYRIGIVNEDIRIIKGTENDILSDPDFILWRLHVG